MGFIVDYLAFIPLVSLAKHLAQPYKSVLRYKKRMKKQNIVNSLKTNNKLLIGTYVGIWCGDGTQY